ncbi:epoxide hydrolase family protein [Actinomadura verrucosospora]|uniref:Microsomal epoxide hydrolase n=1 Tax=Actinomadura verrucosospora TaxID=46165 RepID=A0A7D4A6D2_ACTVE|nr:epoxide hydrolase family protein [Actinomadura verrucosospora]QKG23645.1 microsomal epoxide hydrolase [Actinomadura verrucosospora]
MTEIKPFRIEIPQADVDDLKGRLARTRFADELPAEQFAGKLEGIPTPPGWEYGVPGSYVRPLVERWRDGFDWRAQEARLNRYPQFTTEIDGQSIHFVHVTSPEPDAIPLILTHGWPNMFTEYLGLVDQLTEPGAGGQAFHVVIPSIPGFGFSGPTRERGWNAARTAAAWAELMSRLGYERYGVHGNDAGAIVGPILGELDREHVIGVHVNQIFSFPKGEPGEFEGLTEAEMGSLQFGQAFIEHAIHDRSQANQPQTLAHALADSPSGQLAWIGQLLGDAVEPDDLLTIASLFWFTNTSASSARFYFENRDWFATHQGEGQGGRTSVPIGLASFAFDFKPIRKFAERDHANIVHWNDYERGGHWAAHDASDLLLGDIREFFGKVA